MSDEKKPAAPSGNPFNDLLFILGVIGVLTILWVANGTYKRSTAQNLFFQPPSADTIPNPANQLTYPYQQY